MCSHDRPTGDSRPDDCYTDHYRCTHVPSNGPADLHAQSHADSFTDTSPDFNTEPCPDLDAHYGLSDAHAGFCAHDTAYDTVPDYSLADNDAHDTANDTAYDAVPDYSLADGHSDD